jgi:hypothetical protein
MDKISVNPRQIGCGHTRAYLPVQAVARLQHHLLALSDFQHWRDIGVITVVAVVRLVCEGLRAVDPNCVHAVAPLMPATLTVQSLNVPASGK